MKNVLCWEPEDTLRISNPQAEALPDRVFLAVHTSLPLKIRETLSGTERVVDDQAFLTNFLTPQRTMTLVPIVGDAGTGKSHLVHWLRVRLPSDAKREVIVVRKAGMNLREIVDSLIKRLPKKDQEAYLQELHKTGDVAVGNRQAQRNEFLNHLQAQIFKDTPQPSSLMERETEEYYLSNLANLLLDPFLRASHFSKDGAFAAEIAEHVFERPANYNPVEGRRIFKDSDLPLDHANWSGATRQAKEFIAHLRSSADDGDQEIRDCVTIINRSLDPAIARCMNLSSDRLQEILLKLRKHLKRIGKELIVLIEDLSRVQGYDRAMLQALIEDRPDELCSIRTALAATRGFFEGETPALRQRITFIVDMDNPLDANAHLPRFAAHYMNAIRWGAVELRAEWDRHQETGEPFKLESKCTPCTHRGECHAAFGSVDGIGLYPFTSHALVAMAQRVDRDFEKRFSPRQFQNGVVQPISESGEALRHGAFPPRELLTRLGGQQTVTTLEANKLRNADPPGYERRVTLLELWGNSTKAENLDRRIHEAFDLKWIANFPSGAVSQPSKPFDGSAKLTDEDPLFKELDNWANGHEKLRQASAQALRELVFAHIRNAIDWDAEGLSETYWCGSARPFTAANIYFDNTVVGPTNRLFVLTIPQIWTDVAERDRTVLALQGMLHFQRSKTWEFPGAEEMLSCALACLEAWATLVIGQLRRIDTADQSWDPGIAAFEINVMVAALTNADAKPSSRKRIYQMGWQPPVSLPDYFDPGLGIMVGDLINKAADLQKAIAVRRSAMKGSSTGELLDAKPLLGAAKALQSPDALSHEPPLDSALRTSELQQIARARRHLARDLFKVVQRELAARKGWRTSMLEFFGDATRDAIAASAKASIDEVGGVGLNASTRETSEARSKFGEIDYDRAMAIAAVAEKPGLAGLSLVAAGGKKAADAGVDLGKAWHQSLQQADSQMTNLEKDLAVDPHEYEALRSKIDADLTALGTLLKEVGSGEPN